MWHYQNNPISEAPATAYGFVYLITRISTGRAYVGRKYITMSAGKRKGRKESKWRDYWGSCKPLLEEIKEHGPDAFKREILYWCDTRAATNYVEVEEQFARDVLKAVLPDGSRAYYNSNILSRWFSARSEATDETKAKMSKALLGNDRAKGKSLSEETKKLIGNAKNGRGNKGKPKSVEHKAQLAESNRGVVGSKNISGYCGVTPARTAGKWICKYNRIHIGTFGTIEEAVAARKHYEDTLKDQQGEPPCGLQSLSPLLSSSQS